MSLEISNHLSKERRSDAANPATLDGVIFSFPRAVKEREKPITREVSLRQVLSPDFQNSLERAFKELSDLPANSKSAGILNDLKTYGAGIDTRLDRCFAQKALDLEAVREFFKAGKPAIQAGYHRMLDRLSKETAYLDELAHVGTLQLLKQGAPSMNIGGAQVYFYPKKQWIAYFGRNAAGLCHTGHNRVSIRGKPPTPERTWLALASRGELPVEVSVVHHELVHIGQSRPGFRQFLGTLATAAGVGAAMIGMVAVSNVSAALTLALAVGGCVGMIYAFYKAGRPPGSPARKVHTEESMRAPRGRSAKVESQAWLSHMSLPGTRYNGGLFNFDATKSTVKEILAHSLTYGLGCESKPLVTHAMDLLWSLRLLGVRENELGNLIRDTSAKLGNNSLPPLEKRLAKELRKLGLDSDSAPIVLRALGGKAELEYYFQKFMAKEIATEEMAKLDKRGDANRVSRRSEQPPSSVN